MVLFPIVYQQSGWLPVTGVLVLLTVYTLICSVMILECMTALPNNQQFQRRVEYTTMCKYYLSRANYRIVQCFYQCSLLSMNITTILQSITVCDYVLIQVFGETCAVPQLYPVPDIYCTTGVTDSGTSAAAALSGTPFDSTSVVVSTGFLLCALLCVPLGLYNLDDNIYIQQVSCIGVVAICAIWCTLFAGLGFQLERVPAIGSSYSQLIGVCVFNYAIITSLPSWVNEKHPTVSIGRTLLFAALGATLSFVCVGICGGLAFDHTGESIHTTDNILTHVYNLHTTVAYITFYAWPVVVNFTSIPIFAIMMRYNLIENHVCNNSIATAYSVFVPWIIAVLVYTGSGFTTIITFSGLIVSSFVNFIVPPMLYIHYCNKWTSTDNMTDHDSALHIVEREKRYRAVNMQAETNLMESLLNDDVSAQSLQHSSQRAERWYVVSEPYQQLRVPTAYTVIVSMTVMCATAITMNILQTT